MPIHGQPSSLPLRHRHMPNKLLLYPTINWVFAGFVGCMHGGCAFDGERPCATAGTCASKPTNTVYQQQIQHGISQAEQPAERTDSRCPTPDSGLDVVLLKRFSTSLPARVSSFMQVLRCNGEPVGHRLTDEDFSMYEDDIAISALESAPRILPNARQFRMYSLVLIDLSGSITRSESGVIAVRKAVTEYLTSMRSSDVAADHYVSIKSFDGREGLQEIVPFSTDLDEAARIVAQLKCGGQFCLDTSTNLNGAIIKGLESLESQARTEEIPFREMFLVTLTDGTDRAARISEQDALEKIKISKAHTMTIGLGGEIDEAALKALGQDGSEFAENLSDLEPLFRRAATRVVNLASSFYRVDYCSPKRAGEHRLEIRVRAGSEEGTTSDTFSAEGFTFGCDLNEP